MWLLHGVINKEVGLQDMVRFGYDTVDITGGGVVIYVDSYFTQYRIN